MALALLILISGGNWPWSSSIPLLEGREQGGKVAMYYALLARTKGGELSWSPPHSPSKIKEEKKLLSLALFLLRKKGGVDMVILIAFPKGGQEGIHGLAFSS